MNNQDATTKELSYTRQYFLTASMANADKVMPVTLLAQQVIDVATDHANLLGIGYADLLPRGIGWVLLRLSIEMERWPSINTAYSITTWVERFTRVVSDRCLMVADEQGNVMGYVRTVWAAIDFEKRTAVDLGFLNGEQYVNPQMNCPIPAQRKLLPVGDRADRTVPYTFKYCDIDFNGHVNSVRYIEHILNLWSPEHFAAHKLGRIDLAYVHECRYGQTVNLSEVTDPATGISSVDLMRVAPTLERVAAARIAFLPLNN